MKALIGISLILSLNFSHTFAAKGVISKKVYNFPGSISELVPELGTNKLVVNEGGVSLNFVAWKYGDNKPVSSKGQVVCEFLGFKTYVDSTVKESKATSLKVIIPKHTNSCFGSKYCWGWENAQQDGDYPEFSEYKKNRYGWIAPFMIFESITCADKII